MIKDMPVMVNNEAMSLKDFVDMYGDKPVEGWNFKSAEFYDKDVLMFYQDD